MSGNTYRVVVSPGARRQIKRLQRPARDRILARLLDLERDPRPPGHKKLAGGENLYRIRVGDYRVIYSIEDDILFVLVVKVGHRRDVYR